MAKYTWSPSLAVFNASAPDDVDVSKKLFDELFEGQSKGMLIVSASDGMPTLAEPEQPSAESVAQMEQSRRMSVATQQISILKPAVDGGYAKPEHTQLLADWQRCRYELTLVPEQPGWPDKPQWPTEPEKVI
ncbi:tail fiber assembly protein [Aeromonas jandaei]|uniref:tail fiber assembly protein n=1 Tax=Aeromonas jandaei TaxID=650 RepID=UPI00191EAE79|nr:tail fiber assembly protein [Aeromonas jandaei]MBL0609575.1 tail fiber assembly protein [Aeromonas jandaei]